MYLSYHSVQYIPLGHEGVFLIYFLASIILRNVKWAYFISPSNHVQLQVSHEVVAQRRKEWVLPQTLWHHRSALSLKTDFPKTYNQKARVGGGRAAKKAL